MPETTGMEAGDREHHLLVNCVQRRLVQQILILRDRLRMKMNLSGFAIIWNRRRPRALNCVHAAKLELQHLTDVTLITTSTDRPESPADKDALLVEFMFLVFTRTPGNSVHWQFRSLLLCLLLMAFTSLVRTLEGRFDDLFPTWFFFFFNKVEMDFFF